MEPLTEKTVPVADMRTAGMSTDQEQIERGTDGLKTLRLKRETVRHLGEELFTSQGHSLWTCDMTMDKPLDR